MLSMKTGSRTEHNTLVSAWHSSDHVCASDEAALAAGIRQRQSSDHEQMLHLLDTGGRSRRAPSEVPAVQPGGVRPRQLHRRWRPRQPPVCPCCGRSVVLAADTEFRTKDLTPDLAPRLRAWDLTRGLLLQIRESSDSLLCYVPRGCRAARHLAGALQQGHLRPLQAAYGSVESVM